MKTLEQFVQTISEDNGTVSPAAEGASPFRNKPSKGRFTRYNKFNGVGRLPGVKSNEVNDYEKRLERDVDSARNQFGRLGESESHDKNRELIHDHAIRRLYQAVDSHRAAVKAKSENDTKNYHRGMRDFHTNMYHHLDNNEVLSGRRNYEEKMAHLDAAVDHSDKIGTA